jgi:hypothetical protein
VQVTGSGAETEQSDQVVKVSSNHNFAILAVANLLLVKKTSKIPMPRRGPPRGPKRSPDGDDDEGEPSVKKNMDEESNETATTRRIAGRGAPAPSFGGMQGNTAFASPQLGTPGPTLMTASVKAQVQTQSQVKKSLWGLTSVPTLPEFHPLERTATFIPNTPPSNIAGRIANVLRDRSIEATFDDDKAKITCTTLEGVDFRVRLYRGRAQFSHGIIVEVQRRFGAGLNFHGDTTAILDAAEGRKTTQNISFARKLPEVSDDEDHEDMPPPPSGASSLAMVSKMLQIPGFDGQYLGLQTLSTLVDADRMTPESARRVSQELLRADSEVGASVFSYIMNRKIDDESYRELRVMSLNILASSMKASSIVPEFVRVPLRSVLLQDIKEAEQHSRAACFALGSMKYFVKGDEDVMELNEIFDIALAVGEQRHKHLASMAQTCIAAIR